MWLVWMQFPKQEHLCVCVCVCVCVCECQPLACNSFQLEPPWPAFHLSCVMAQAAGKASNLQRWQDSIARGEFPKTLYVHVEKSWKCIKRVHTREHTLCQVGVRVWERELQLCFSMYLVFGSRPGIAGLICSKSKHGRYFQKFKRNACCQAYPSLPALPLQ